jgi:hypothetical protein
VENFHTNTVHDDVTGYMFAQKTIGTTVFCNNIKFSVTHCHTFQDYKMKCIITAWHEG